MAEKPDIPRQVFLHGASLVGRRAADWLFDVIATASVGDGNIRDEACGRFIASIEDALDILREARREEPPHAA